MRQDTQSRRFRRYPMIRSQFPGRLLRPGDMGLQFRRQTVHPPPDALLQAGVHPGIPQNRHTAYPIAPNCCPPNKCRCKWAMVWAASAP